MDLLPGLREARTAARGRRGLRVPRTPRLRVAEDARLRRRIAAVPGGQAQLVVLLLPPMIRCSEERLADPDAWDPSEYDGDSSYK